MEIKVLGTGCSNCKSTVNLLAELAKEKGVSVNIEKIENIQDIMGYNILATPGVGIKAVLIAGGCSGEHEVAQIKRAAAGE